MMKKDFPSQVRLPAASKNQPAKYSAPRLIKYGPVASVTGSGGSGLTDFRTTPESGPMAMI